VETPHGMYAYEEIGHSGMARCAELAGLDVTIADFNCCSWV